MTSTAPSRNHHHKPLHNFSLPFLNWGQKPRNTNTADVRTHPTKPPSDVTKRRRRTPRHDDDDVAYHDHHHKTSKPTNSEDDDVSLKLESDKLVDVDVAAAVEVEVEVKPWKLRPRRAVTKGGNGEVNVNVNVNGERSSGRLLRTVEVVSAEVAAAAAEEEERERVMKRRLWISLSKDEIEQDMLLFTGAKPVRRPKKRNKIAQKHLDNVFPGLYLVGMSADSYRL